MLQPISRQAVISAVAARENVMHFSLPIGQLSFRVDVMVPWLTLGTKLVQLIIAKTGVPANKVLGYR